MEQVIFLHVDEEREETLSQMQRSTAQRLVLVAPARMDRLRLSLLLRLARRSLIAQAKEVCLVSEDRLARLLAERMGFAVAATLDEYRGLTPGQDSPTRKRASRPAARRAFPPSRPPAAAPAAPASPRPGAPAFSAPAETTAAQPEKPGANLDKMLVDGYLPNPAATPDLEEEQERAEWEEQERQRQERLHYEIDEEQPSRAQQEAERHEERITFRILKTSQSEPSTTSPETNAPPENDLSDLSVPPAERRADVPRPPEDRAAHGNRLSKDEPGSLRPMRTIDELLREQGRGEVFDWFEHQATRAAKTGDAAPHTTGVATATAVAAVAAPPSALPEEAGHQPPPRIPQPARPKRRGRPGPPGASAWQRAGVIGALALSVLMIGVGLALVPSAEVGYREEISAYSESLLFDIRPDGAALPTTAPSGAPARAELARFDGIMTAQASATGLRAAPGAPNHLVAFPTQADADQTASQLQARLQQWGANALRAQAGPEDILGPIIADEEMLAFPAVGASLPVGISRFQVSVALHLRATLIRRAALLAAARQQLRQDVSRTKPGFAPRSENLNILSVVPAGPGEQQLELLVRARANAMIGPSLTPEQARAAIAGLALPEAEAYLDRQPGISAVSISVQPKWLNRLPIFSARIRIILEN